MIKKLGFILTVFSTLCACQSPEARQPVSVQSASFVNQSVAMNRQLIETQREQIEALIKSDTGQSFITSPYGFWYAYDIKVEGDSIQPKFGDRVNFIYEVKDLDNNSIYTREQIGIQEYAMEQEELFSGLREGLKLMKTGETVTFLFPSHKAYGYYGDNDKIGVNMPIKCRVTLNSINEKRIQ
jgi:gliding motility-associated peptidyl-prolyl isomerase